MANNNQLFWQELIAVESFNMLFNEAVYQKIPDNWYVFVADIEGSTQAIDQGRYKEVNLIGALSIIAVLNACKSIEIPYVFGGDGATILVPPGHYQSCLNALLATKARALENFSINLRVGAVSVALLSARKFHLNIAKLQLSPDYQQAIFLGGGLSQAENLIKGDKSYCFELPNAIPEADFDGLECRWKDIPSSKEETISLLIQAANIDSYDMILDRIEKLIGTYKSRHPIQASNLSLSFSHSQLAYESNAKYKGIKRHIFVVRSWLENLLGVFLITLGRLNKQWPWGRYKQQVQITTDAEKFDDMLRMVCCVTSSQRKALEQYLNKEQAKGVLNYGIHISDRALMTCLVFERHGRQVHFVDAADGGYALAAKMLKQQMK